MNEHLLKEAQRLIKWAEQNIKGPSKLNTELQDWLKLAKKAEV